ncbi:double-strand break repair helicase AddA [uncultured Amaricoccus sp.]|uniref:double-strand break repair helicase AddA n=2 Tax=Amaricoccus TaxID=56999 RepID=UPI002612FADA|nr:double-strand break repair helicase AddA [uncultured Amaricoccus sp.]
MEMNAALEAQIRAATPDASSWVSANAGSGKTRVLTDRVARLLLSGTDPGKILCLTYTKAAAAEMQNRLFAALGRWAMLGDAELRAALRALGEPGATIPPVDLDRARTLFARALETPGGLKIQTIHAFCDSLLRRFPLEAGVAPRFSVLEDRQARALREAALDAVAEAEPAIFGAMAFYLGGGEPDPFLAEIAHARALFAGPFDAASLAARLGAPAGVTPADLLAEVAVPEAALRALIPILLDSSPADHRLAHRLAGILAAPERDRLPLLEDALLFGANTKAPFTPNGAPTKAIRGDHPALVATLDALEDRVATARPRRVALSALAKSATLNQFARAFLDRYDARKRALGALDFDDLIERSVRLLERPETAAWVLYRLDGGLDHILVDEAQDTSPSQWRVIEAISAEFFTGLGAREVARTIFVVGDEKQSIYSFQGAAPGAFDDMRRFFEARLAEQDDALRRCDLLYSFRSAPTILRLVDTVFNAAQGAGLADGVAHHAQFPDQPGRVELWPFLPKPETPEESPWDEPLDALTPEDPIALLANRVAERIRSWLDSGQPLPGAGRPVRAGDVLILVQRRDELFDAIIRALKAAGVPVAGADLLRVGGELAVKDLLAALRFAATPGDDLSLAAFLRGPLGEVGEEELFGLAHPRTGTLWAELRGRPAEEFARVRALLADMLAQADYLRPYEMLQRLLIRHDGRRRLTGRLGTEAEDGIDALLDQALAYEGVEAPSLTGFLAWIDRDEMKVKRRMDTGADQVRVMTVHGAKGLEAPIVILPDTATRREPRVPEVLPLGGGAAAWRMTRGTGPAPLEEADAGRRAPIRAENLRLLYVALTRPRNWLIVCGAGVAPRGDAWHGIVRSALESLAPRTEPGPDGDILFLDHNWAEAGPAAALTPPEAPADPPAWAARPAPARRPAPASLSPSGLGGGHALPAEVLLPEIEALARGEAVHRLLEHLRDADPAGWPALAARLLPGFPDPAEILAEAAAVLTAPALAEIFGPGTLAEVDIAAPLGALGGRTVVGRIDRLVVSGDRVLAVDFKSNRVVPDRPEQVPEGILRQMGAYHAALGHIWPGRRIEAAILWTRAARLMPLPAKLIGDALARAHLDPDGVGS